MSEPHLTVSKVHKQISEANFSLPPAPLQPPNRSRRARRKREKEKRWRKIFRFFSRKRFTIREPTVPLRALKNRAMIRERLRSDVGPRIVRSFDARETFKNIREIHEARSFREDKARPSAGWNLRKRGRERDCGSPTCADLRYYKANDYRRCLLSISILCTRYPSVYIVRHNYKYTFVLFLLS